MLEMMSEPTFWVSVAQIIAIDILLGGDNAVVIALACRGLPPAQRTQGILWGVVGAIALRIMLIFFAVELLTLPFLKIVGGLLLLWIGAKLLLPQDEGHGDVEASTTLLGAVRTVIIADAVMSIDNVVAVASAAHGHMTLVVFGIVVSVPIIVWGSRLVLMLMDRFPIVITLGAALLGWIGGGMWLGDAWVEKQFGPQPSTLHYIGGAVGAAIVILTGRWLGTRVKPAV